MSLSYLAEQQVARSVGGGVRAQNAAGQQGEDRFDLLTKYIPTESITLFVAAMSAFPAISESFPSVDRYDLYWAGAVLTPAILLLAGYGKLRATGMNARFRPRIWPLIASVIAYLVWALSVPGMLDKDSDRILAGVGAMLVSTVLSLFDRATPPQAMPPGDIQR
ncbi:MAG: hypothetical protein ABW182_02535 [Sphingomonas sp.]